MGNSFFRLDENGVLWHNLAGKCWVHLRQGKGGLMQHEAMDYFLFLIGIHARIVLCGIAV